MNFNLNDLRYPLGIAIILVLWFFFVLALGACSSPDIGPSAYRGVAIVTGGETKKPCTTYFENNICIEARR